MNLRHLCLTTSIVLCLGFASAHAQQWNSYRGPNRDGTVASDLALSGKLKVHWKVPANLGFSSFSLAQNKALTLVSENDQEVCLALDSATGQELWRAKLGSNKYDGGGAAGAKDNRGGDGPRSTPTINDGMVYVYDAHMNLVCLKLETGTEVWRHNIKTEFKGKNIKWQNAISPVVDDARVYVCGGGVKQSMLAFDKKSGAIIWKYGNEKMTHATPTLTSIDGQSQSKELWRNEFDYRTSTAASPVVFDNHVYGSAGYGVGAKLFQVKNNQSELTGCSALKSTDVDRCSALIR